MLQVGVQSSSWFDREDPDGSFRFIKECGFDAVDFNIDNFVSVSDLKKVALQSFFDQTEEEILAYFKPFKEAAERYGVRFSQMHAPFPVYDEERPDFNDYMMMVVEKCLAVCAYVGCPAIVVHPKNHSDKQKEIEYNMIIYRRLMPAARKYRVKICLENLFITTRSRNVEGACSNVDEAIHYIDTLNAEAGEELFGFCLDIGHANILGRNPRWYIDRLGSRLTILHLHDNDGKQDLHMMPYSYANNWGKDQVCDWEGFLHGLADVNYQGTLSFETFRVQTAFPKPLWGASLRLIAEIGRYWANRIEEIRAEEAGM